MKWRKWSVILPMRKRRLVSPGHPVRPRGANRKCLISKGALSCPNSTFVRYSMLFPASTWSCLQMTQSTQLSSPIKHTRRLR